MEHMNYAKRGEPVITQRLDDGTGWCVKGVPGQIIAEFYGDDAEQNAREYAEWYSVTHEQHAEKIIEEYRKQTIIGFRWDMDYVREAFADGDDGMEGVETLTFEEVKYHMNQSAYDDLGYFLEGLADELYDAVDSALKHKKNA